MYNEFSHQPVLLAEVIEHLAIKPAGVYVDATWGRGGHSEALLAKLNAKGRVLGLDKDPQAIAYGRQKFAEDKRLILEQASFVNLKTFVEKHGLLGQVDGVLLDLGVSSPQLDDGQRGFSFLREGPLDMRMDPTTGISIAKWLETVKEATLIQILKEYGEERFARRIGKAIIMAKAVSPIATTHQLAAIVSAAHPAWEVGRHPATRTFQALRIFINQELTELQQCLPQCLDVLAVGGRLAVISFHSLEDRLVKRFIRDQVKGKDLPKSVPVTVHQLQQRLRNIGRAIKPSAMEITANPRARSAVLRVAEKIL